MLSKAASSTIFWVFGITRPGIEPGFLGPLANTLTIMPMNNQQQKKRIWKIVDFAVPVDHRIKLKECDKKDKYLDQASELKKTVYHQGDNFTNCDWCFWYSN